MIGEMGIMKNKYHAGHKTVIKTIIVFFLIQLAICILFLWQVNGYQTVGVDDLKTSVVKVEKISYDYVFMIGDRLRFFSDNKEYGFPNIPVIGTNEYSMHQLSSAISEGDDIMVEYVEDDNSRTVYGAKKGNEILRSAKGYNSFVRQQRTIGCILLLIIEILFLCAFAFFVFVYQKVFKKPKKKSNKPKETS